MTLRKEGLSVRDAADAFGPSEASFDGERGSDRPWPLPAQGWIGWAVSQSALGPLPSSVFSPNLAGPAFFSLRSRAKLPGLFSFCACRHGCRQSFAGTDDCFSSSGTLSPASLAGKGSKGELAADVPDAEPGGGHPFSPMSRPRKLVVDGGSPTAGTDGYRGSPALGDCVPTSWSSDIVINRVTRFQIRLRSPWRHDLWQRAECAHSTDGFSSGECEQRASGGGERSQRGTALPRPSATRGSVDSSQTPGDGGQGARTLRVDGGTCPTAKNGGHGSRRVLGCRRSYCIVEVEIRSVEDAALFVCFSKPKRAEFLLVNHTRRVVQFSQTGSGLKHRADKDFLLPGERCDFAWQEPQRSRRIMRFSLVENGQVYSRNCEIERVKQHRSLQLPPQPASGGGSSKGGDKVYFVTDVHQGRRIVIISETCPRASALSAGWCRAPENVDGVPQLRGCGSAAPFWRDVGCPGQVLENHETPGPLKQNCGLVSTWRSLHREVSLLKPFSLISRRLTNCVTPRVSAARAQFPVAGQLATRSSKDPYLGAGTSFPGAELGVTAAARSRDESRGDRRRVSAPPRNGPKTHAPSDISRSASDEMFPRGQPARMPGSPGGFETMRTRLEIFNILSLVSPRRASGARGYSTNSEGATRPLPEGSRDLDVPGPDDETLPSRRSRGAWISLQSQQAYCSFCTRLHGEEGRHPVPCVFSPRAGHELLSSRIGQRAEGLSRRRLLFLGSHHNSEACGATPVMQGQEASASDHERLRQPWPHVSRRRDIYYRVPSVFLESEERGTGPCLMVAADRRGSSCSSRSGSLERFLRQTKQRHSSCDGQVDYEESQHLRPTDKRMSGKSSEFWSEALHQPGAPGAGSSLPFDERGLSADTEEDWYGDSGSPSDETEDQNSSGMSTVSDDQTQEDQSAVRLLDGPRADRTASDNVGTPVRSCTAPAAATSSPGWLSRANRNLSLLALSRVDSRQTRRPSRPSHLNSSRRSQVYRSLCSRGSNSTNATRSGDSSRLGRRLVSLRQKGPRQRTRADNALKSISTVKPLVSVKLNDGRKRRMLVGDLFLEGCERSKASNATAQDSGGVHGQDKPSVFGVDGYRNSELASQSAEARPAARAALASGPQRRCQRKPRGSWYLRRPAAGSHSEKSQDQCDPRQKASACCGVGCGQQETTGAGGTRQAPVRGGEEPVMGSLFLWKRSRGDSSSSMADGRGGQVRSPDCSLAFPQASDQHAGRCRRTPTSPRHDTGENAPESSSWFFSLVGTSSFLLQVRLRGCGISLVDDQPQELLYIGATDVEAAARRLDVCPVDFPATSVPDRPSWAVSIPNTLGTDGGKHSGRTDFRFTITRLQVDNGTQGARHATVVRPCTAEELAEHQGSGTGQKTRAAATLGDGVLTAAQVDSIIASSVQPYIVWDDRPGGCRLRGRRRRVREPKFEECACAVGRETRFLRVQFGGRSGREATVLQYFDCALAPTSIHFEVDTTFELVQYLMKFVQLKNAYFRALQARSVEEVREASSLDPRTAGFRKFRACPSVPPARVADQKPLYIRTFCIRPIQVLISARAPRAYRRHLSTSGRDILAVRHLQLVGGRMTDVTNFPMKFRLVLQRAVFSTSDQLGEALLRFYVQQGLRQVHKLVASIDIIGNPLSLFTDVSVGTRALVRDPFARGEENNLRTRGAFLRRLVWVCRSRDLLRQLDVGWSVRGGTLRQEHSCSLRGSLRQSPQSRIPSPRHYLSLCPIGVEGHSC